MKIINLTINQGNVIEDSLSHQIKLSSVGKVIWGNEHFPYSW